MFSIGIVGGGHAGYILLNLVHGLSDIKVRWICDINNDAEGMQHARKLHIETKNDFIPLIKDPALDIVIEVTGSEKVFQLVEANKHSELTLIGAKVAKFLLSVAKRQEMMDKLNEQAKQLLDGAKALTDNIDLIRTSMQQLNHEVETVSQLGRSLNDAATGAMKAVFDTQNILKLIQEVASRTNIIGLNAGIEAARVGAAGKGFVVVANEIRKLAENTNNSTKRIKENIENIITCVNNISSGINQTVETSNRQIVASKSTMESLERISFVSNGLMKMADDLVNLS